jgi:hypothetical protein
MHELKTATGLHPLLRKWWMRARAIKAEVTSAGIGGAYELYCPWWAKPLEWLHGALFGITKLEPV